MRKYIGLSLCIIGLFFALLSGCANRRPVVLLIARETSDNMALMLEKEVNPILAKLKEAGFQVTVASESGAKIVSGQMALTVDKKLEDVKIHDIIGVIVPCMAAGGTQKAIPHNAVELVADASKAAIPLAAQQSGVEILGLAGALRGKNFAIAEASRGYIKDGTFKGVGVVRDGNIVTSGTCPFMAAEYGLKDGTEELITQFIAVLKK